MLSQVLQQKFNVSSFLLATSKFLGDLFQRKTLSRRSFASNIGYIDILCVTVEYIQGNTITRVPSLMAKHITSQDNILIRGRSECRKGLSETAKPVENCLRQTMTFKASAQTGATEFSKEK